VRIPEGAITQKPLRAAVDQVVIASYRNTPTCAPALGPPSAG